MRSLILLRLIVLILATGLGLQSAQAQTFVEYPGHNATYGDHTIANSPWVAGPTTLVVAFEGDGTLHEDGIGASQRTARNSLTFTPPADPANPQNYDDSALIDAYGDRLPLLQELAASGTAVLIYSFDSAINLPLDLFITDVDQSDSVFVRAYTENGVPQDMNAWFLAAEGDLSQFKDTGTVFSPIIAPPPITLFSSTAITLDAIDDTNYNRSYSVLRAPPNSGLTRIEIEFTGTRNSPNRAAGGNASHVYVALSTVPEPVAGTMFLVGSAYAATLARLKHQKARPPA